MRIEFYRPPPESEPDDAPPQADVAEAIGSATWEGRDVSIETDDDDVRAALTRIFRAMPIVTSDASYRQLGTSGEVVVQPGTLEWFRAAAFGRATEAGLVARAVPGVSEGGWDPAAQYRTFNESMDQLLERP